MSDAPDNEAVEAGAATENEAPKADPRAQLEAAARKSGWAAKDEWKGDPDAWTDAPEFILKAVGDVLPNMRKSLEDARTELTAVKKTLKDFGDHHSKTEARAYERAIRDLQAQIAHSTATGDVQGVLNATDELADLRAEAKAPRAVADELPTEFVEWRAANPWFGKDRALTAAAVALGAEVLDEGFTGKAQIKEVDRRLREQFPDKFENPNRKAPGQVEGGSAPPRRAGKTYSDLPPEAKAACDDFVKRIPGFKRETYVKEYFEQ